MIIVLSLVTIISGLIHIYSHNVIRQILKEENQKVNTLFDIEDIGLFYRLCKYNDHLEGKRKLFWFAVIGLLFWISGMIGLVMIIF